MFLGLAAIAVGYLLGAIPTAYIMARLRKGIDIREVDVGNVGAAAVIRQVGRVVYEPNKLPLVLHPAI